MRRQIKVVVTDYIEPDLEWERQELRKREVDFETYQLRGAPEGEVIAATRDADIVVVNMVKLTHSVIAGWDKVRLVIRHGTGYDNVDCAALTERGIVLEYIPDYCLDEVAEQAIALMFACGRKIVWSLKMMDGWITSQVWDARSLTPIYRMDGATVGIIGCGRIGSLVYKKLRHFGMKFLVCDPYLSAERKKELGIEVQDLETVCRGSDFITVHTPLSAETRHIINAETLAYMKPTAYLVNTSRGAMVDAHALATVLKARKIAGAAIDVYGDEPPAPDFPLLGLDNVILTPHLSWYSEDASQTIREKILLDIDMFLTGTGPRFPVNPEALEKRKDATYVR